MNVREVTHYLQNAPHGATCIRIAKDLGCDLHPVEKTMAYMHRFERVYVSHKGRGIADSVWVFQKKKHVAVFRAAEILEAFQAAAMAKLLEANGVMA